MKSPAWKLVVVCLMLVAIPLKGMAALAWTLCDAQHHALYTSAASTTSGGEAASASNLVEDHHAHHANHVTQVGHADHATPGTDGAAEHTHADGSHGKCSACGSCCAATAMASQALNFASPFGTEAIFPEPSSHHVGPLVRGLDRPPQVRLA